MPPEQLELDIAFENYRNEIRSSVRSRMIDCDMTLAHLAFMAGVSSSTVRNFLVSSKGNMRLKTLFKISRALNCTLGMSFANNE